MRILPRVTPFVLAPALFAGLACGQASGQAPASRVIGEVKGLNAASGEVSLRTDRGEVVTVIVGVKTALRKVPPGVQDLSAATRIELAGIGIGDRVLAIGQSSEDQKKVEARTVIVMTRSDLDQKRKAEQEDWRKRGVAGTVSAVDQDAKTFTIRAGSRSIIIQPVGKTEYRRYAPDSVRFADALPSTLAEIQLGDQVRALGERTGDGNGFAAERIVSGSFRQIAATIVSLDVLRGEFVVKDLESKKTLTARVSSDTEMRRLPAELAATLAARYKTVRSAPSAPAGGGDDIGQVLERLPAIPLSDLMSGDAIMLSTTAGSESAHVTAVMLLAGVEPLLAASPNSTHDIMGGWNLGGAEAQ